LPRCALPAEKGSKKITELLRVPLPIIAAVVGSGRLPLRGRAEIPALFKGPQLLELVVFSPFGRVFQHLKGFAQPLELLLGAGFLADIRMVFPRQLAISLFDFIGRRVFCDPENFVVVLLFHRRPIAFAAKMVKASLIVSQFSKISPATGLLPEIRCVRRRQKDRPEGSPWQRQNEKAVVSVILCNLKNKTGYKPKR
jgi:hypothetical protein